MTDPTDHYTAARAALSHAIEWGRQAEEPTPEDGEMSCLAYAAVHALLAIADALTADHRAANEERQRERQREEELEDAWQSRDWETVRRLQDEAEQREDAPAPEPLDEPLCPECGHGIDSHGWDVDYAITCCLACDDPGDCRKAPSDIARHLIARATS